jgi:hypothetical protein
MENFMTDLFPHKDDPEPIKRAIDTLLASGKGNAAISLIRTLRVRHFAGVDITDEAEAAVLSLISPQPKKRR